MMSQAGLNRLFLHAYRLNFQHPVSGEEVSFEAPLDKSLQQVLSNLEKQK